jgi:hypothetical protein
MAKDGPNPFDGADGAWEREMAGAGGRGAADGGGGGGAGGADAAGIGGAGADEGGGGGGATGILDDGFLKPTGGGGGFLPIGGGGPRIEADEAGLWPIFPKFLRR